MSLQIDRARVEVPYPCRWWGSDYMCDPRFVEAALGDGMVLIGLQPLNTRPHYYVIRVDSSWHLHNCRVCDHKERCSDELPEHLEEIYEAIEDEYGDRRRVEECNAEALKEDPKYVPESSTWPVFDDEVGTSWFLMDRPEQFAPTETV